MTREQWLAERQKGIGASDAPIVLGLSPWKSPLDLWAEKRGLVDAVIEQTEAQRMGHLLEPVVASLYQERHPDHVVVDFGPHTIQRHREYPEIIATLDRSVLGDGCAGALEIKTTSSRFADQWEDEAPLMYQVQLQHQLAVTGYTWGVLAVLIDGREYREFVCERNDRFIDGLIRTERHFWDRVKHGVEPSCEPTPAYVRSLERLHPDDNGESVTLDGEFFAVDEELSMVNGQIKALESRKADLEARIKSAIGAATYGVLPGVASYSWKTQERKPYQVNGCKFRQLRRKAEKKG